ncbi:hypothetical protein Tco_0516276 [Tanacetum coccineum]
MNRCLPLPKLEEVFIVLTKQPGKPSKLLDLVQDPTHLQLAGPAQQAIQIQFKPITQIVLTTSLPIIPTVNVTQRQNSKELSPKDHFKVTIQIIKNRVVVTKEILIAPGKSPNAQQSPVANAHTGNTQMGIDWDTLIFYWHTHMYNPVKQCMINVQLFNAQNLISIAKLCKSNPVSVEFFSSHFLVKDLRTGAPLLRGENIGDVYCVTFPLTSYHFISIDGSPLIDSQHPIPSQTTTQPSTYDSPIPSSTPQAPSSPQQPTDSPSLPPSVTLSPALATFQEQTPDIFEEEHTPHTFQQHTPNTSDQQHTHSPPVTSQSPGPHATTSQPPQTQSNLQRPTHEKKRNPKCFNEKYVNTASKHPPPQTLEPTTETIHLNEFVNNLSIKFSIKDLGATYLCVNPVYHSRMKHVALDYHFVRERVSEGSLRVLHISSKDQLADMLTKPLGRSQFMHFRSKIGVSDGSSIL